MKPERPPVQATPIRDHTKYEHGRGKFMALVNRHEEATAFTDADLQAALYYTGSLMTPPEGGNAAKKLLHAEAQKRGMLT